MPFLALIVVWRSTRPENTFGAGCCRSSSILMTIFEPYLPLAFETLPTRPLRMMPPTYKG